MSIAKRHDISIVVNGEQLDVESQDKLNLRINNTIYNPEKISVTQSEYSFSFNVPQSPKNNRIFGFANVPSVKGKFVKQFNTYVYADNVEIFKGLLRISSISDGNYKCNLISVKNSSIDEIFGDTTMNQLRWDVPYLGTDTQNAVNQQVNPDYFYPLVCYGVFQKDPYLKIEGEDTKLNYYTSTNLLDKWAKFYNQTFIPSPKLLCLIKKMIEQRGYTYSGDAFSDRLLDSLYLSSYITKEQDPSYNYGSGRGKINVNYSYSVDAYKGKYPINYLNSPITRDLTYPEYNGYLNGEKQDSSLPNDVGIMYRAWQGIKAVITQDNDELYESGYIVIPHDGFYKIKFNANVQLTDTASSVEDSYPHKDRDVIKRKKYTRQMDLDKIPIDVQLVRNGSMELEFISTNRINALRNPNQPLFGTTDYPHEAMPASSGSIIFGNQRAEFYFQDAGKTRGYDPKVNGDFLMGMSTAVNGWGIIKKGKGWDATVDYYGQNNYKCEGYSQDITDYGEFGGTPTHTVITNTPYQNYDTDVPSCTYSRLSAKQSNGTGYAVMWLNKGDMLDVRLLTKEYKTYADEAEDGEITYTVPSFNVSGNVSVEAFSPIKKDLMKSWNSPSAFDVNLNLGNFLSEEETQKDFFNNFLTTFNLSCNIEGKNIDIRKNVGISQSGECVEIDNRVTTKDIEADIIDFPTSIDVKFTIDDSESGFYHSVPNDHINDDDWKEWGDRGNEKIELIRNDFSTNDISKTSRFSRNWMMDFYLTDYFDENRNHLQNQNVRLTIPIIAKDEDFIDGANYEEMMQKDGRSLKQRLWFKDEPTPYYVPNRNGAIYAFDEFISAKEYINICLPTNLYDGEDVLKYTRDKGSILMRYFNIDENVDSNYATVEVYLTPQEYIRLRNGAMVRVDNDNYRICTITGYDPSGANKSKIKMMKM